MEIARSILDGLSARLTAVSSKLFEGGPDVSLVGNPSLASAGGISEVSITERGRFLLGGQIAQTRAVFLVDTGATLCAMSPEFADEAPGLLRLGELTVQTASGVIPVKVMGADLMLSGGIEARRVRFAVIPGLELPILGTDVLRKLRYTFDGSEMLVHGLATRRA